MADQKPGGISDEEWAQTPPAVRQLLSQSLNHIQQLDSRAKSGPAIIPPYDNEATLPKIDPAIMAANQQTNLPPSDDKATYILDDGGPADDDGATVNMLLDEDPVAEGATITLPPTDTRDTVETSPQSFLDDVSPADDDGATVNMLLDEDSAAEGATITMPPTDTLGTLEVSSQSFLDDASPADDDGTTVNMLFDEDPAAEGTTITMPPVDTLGTLEVPSQSFLDDVSPADDDGATVNMLLDEDPAADDGATFFMDADTPADDNKTSVNMLDTLPTDDGGATVAMPPTLSTDAEGATGFGLDEMTKADEGGTAYMPDTRPGHPAADDDDDGRTAILSNEALSALPADISTVAVSPVQKTAMGVKKKAAPATLVLEKPKDDLWVKNIVLQSRYRLRRTLGKGGFGAAYLSEDIKLKRGCVIKQMLNPQGISAKELKMRQASFEREAELLVKLNHPGHPNIPDIFDYFSDQNSSYLVMKYIEGQSLQGVAKDESHQLPWDRAVRYIVDVCSALHYMHTQGEEPVMHRDIKPDNVLLGDDGRIWLVDFGLAQAQPVTASGNLSSEQQASSGSVGYTPMEQWLGETVIASDVYAVGVTLHYLLTNLNPLDAYRGADGELQVNIVILRDLHGQLDPVRSVNKELPRELEDIVIAATSSEPEQRPTALQLQQQLEALLSGGQDMALFTFKNGVSAHTIPELVDLCEQNRVEAQRYLYRGDFKRWFTLINRNDLAEAAVKAVKIDAGKDGLERFLKLIMPHLRWRRLGRAAIKTARVGFQLLLILLIALILVLLLGTLGGRWAIQRAIAGYDWDYYTLELDKDNEFDEAYLSENVQDMTRLFLNNVKINPQSPEQVDVSAYLGILYLNTPLALGLENQQPRVMFSELNDTPLYFIGDYLSGGINDGIDEALGKAPINITALEVTDEAIIINVEKSGRGTWNPPTPLPEAIPSPTPTPLPTPTPRSQALLAVFNDLDKDVRLEIEGQSWIILAHDTKVVEKLPGTYEYAITYIENGLSAARGTKTWEAKAYKVRIGLTGATFE